jgi:acetyl/propionyl-CoA carboxylase alpha subunit
MTIRSLCIANRGEIAARVIRTARAMGITTVALFSDADADLPYVREADRAVGLPGSRAADTYLAIEQVIDAATRGGADAVHPGYGFLSERAEFARACAAAGLTFVGPSPEAIERMGSKLEAKRIMAAAGVPVLPGGEIGTGDDFALDTLAVETGFPVMVKAAMGGGGRGMRLVHDPADLVDAVASAAREAEAAFGDGTLFFERFVESPRHIEVQIFGDAHGTVVSLFERECSVQRRHQKIIEEAPSPAVDDAMRAELGNAAVAAAKAIGYVGAGTVEFVADGDGHFWFLEMNTRLQVEHPVTELITGLDLVAVQLAVAAGEPLPPEVLTATITGHAVEARLYAEDVAAGFVPMSGRLDRFVIPAGDGVRVDAGYETGSVVSAHYDAMLAKVIAHAPTRSSATAAVARVLRESELHGVPTNRDLLVGVLEHPEFAAARIDTGFLDRHQPAELVATPTEDLVITGAIAAVLARRAAQRAQSPLPTGIPQGWHNVGPAFQPVALEAGARRIVVEVAGDGPTPRVQVDGEPEPVTVFALASAGDQVALEARGVRRTVAVHLTALTASTIYVDADGTSIAFEVEERFPLPEEVVAPGSLVAPMPGGVVLVTIAVGDHVDGGTVLVTLEAMKMEHVVRAPAAGTVREVRIAVGDQVDTGDVLVVIEADGAEPDA